MSTYAITDPTTGETVKTYPTANATDVEEALASADSAYHAWKSSSVQDRSALLHRVADLYAERRETLAATITQEMGKPIVQARMEIDICESIHRYYAVNGARFLNDEELETVTGATAWVRREGLGPLLGIMPWNFPHYQVARFAAPNIMNGNTVIIKHAPQCPASAAAIVEIWQEASASSGVYSNIYATNEQIAEMIADARIQGVSLTGSERAGSAVAEVAGRHLKKVVLELGGSDPFILLDTEDLEGAVQRAIFGRMVNSGQACNASKRFIIASEFYNEFVEKFTEALSDIVPADPRQEETLLGPLSSSEAVDRIEEQVLQAVGEGAQVLTGGRRGERPNSYLPTILSGVTPEMKAFSQEFFGPVAMVLRAENRQEAIRLANSTPYGLGASIHTEDNEAAVELAQQIEAGMVYVNEPGGTSAELPFGGVKRSGFGRELSRQGMDEFVNKKLIHIKR